MQREGRGWNNIWQLVHRLLCRLSLLFVSQRHVTRKLYRRRRLYLVCIPTDRALCVLEAFLIVSGTNLRPTGPFAGIRGWEGYPSRILRCLVVHSCVAGTRVLFSELNRRRSAGGAFCLGARSTRGSDI